MISTKLIDDISPYLNQAEEIWIAVALMNEVAFDQIQSKLSETAKQNYLVGIDLPTTPAVLTKLKEKLAINFNAGIYKSTEVFHPKVYIIKTKDGFIASIGSSNLTEGGLFKNTELNFCITDEHLCIELIQWFNKLQKQSYPLTDENLQSYSENFLISKEYQDAQKASKNKIILKRPIISDDSLSGIDFADRFFKKEHHLAFHKDLWRDTSLSANKAREKTSKRFMELHEIIFPKFGEYGLTNLHTNVANHIVSLYHQNPHRIQDMNAMWLSYGKPQHEIREYHKLFLKVTYKDEEDDLQSFINHARIQIRLELKEIGIWILFGKNNKGSVFDRQHFLEYMKRESYRIDFFDLLKKLPSNYWIIVNSRKQMVSEFNSPQSLYEYCRRDRPENYFIIGRDYKITDPEMSEANLPETVLREFKRLHPLYNMMKDKRFSK